MSFSTKNEFINRYIQTDGQADGAYEQALVNGKPADFVRVRASVQKTAALILYYANDGAGQGEIQELYTLSPNNLTSVNSFIKKSWVKISVTNLSTAQTVNVRTMYDIRPVPSLNNPTYCNNVTDNIIAKVEINNNTNITTPIYTSASSISAYGTQGALVDDNRSILTDASGHLIIVTKEDKLSITGPVGITGPLYITGPVTTSGVLSMQTQSETVSISGNMNCNINPGQYVNTSGGVTISGNMQISIPPGQLISISGPVTVSGTINMAGPNQTGLSTNVVLSDPTSISGSINCNIHFLNNEVTVTGPTYTVLTDICGSLTYISNSTTINVNGINSLLTSAVITQWQQTSAIPIVYGGVKCTLIYKDNTSTDGDIAILCSSEFPFNWEYIGIITPIVSGSERFAFITINVSPFKYISIQNLSSITRTSVYCTLYSSSYAGMT